MERGRVYFSLDFFFTDIYIINGAFRGGGLGKNKYKLVVESSVNDHVYQYHTRTATPCYIFFSGGGAGNAGKESEKKKIK